MGGGEPSSPGYGVLSSGKWMRGSVSQKGVSADKTPAPSLTARGQRRLPLAGSWGWRCMASGWVTWEGRPAPGPEPPGVNVPSHAGPPVLPWEHTRHPLGVRRPEVAKGKVGSQPQPAGPGPRGRCARTAARFPAWGPPGSRHKTLHVDSALAPRRPEEWTERPSPHSAPPLSHCLRLFLTRQSLRLQS